MRRSQLLSLVVVVSSLSLVMCGGDDEAAPGDRPPTAADGGADGAVGPGDGGDVTADGAAPDGAAPKGAVFSFLRTFSGGFLASPGHHQLPVVAMPGGGYALAFVFSGTLPVGNGTLVSTGYRDVAIVVVDAAGNPVRGNLVQVSDETHPRGLAVDAAGNLYFAALSFSSSVDLGDGKTVTGNDVAQWGLVAKYDASGVAQWGRSFSSSGGLGHFTVAARNDRVVVAGYFTLSGGVVYGAAGGTKTSPTFMNNESKGFVASLDPATGLASWFEQLSAASGGKAWDVAVTPASDVLVAGEFAGGALQSDDPLTLGPSTGAKENAFVTKLTGAGTHAWTRTFGAATSEPLDTSVVATDASGRIVVAGKLGGQVDFGKGPRAGTAWIAALDDATGATTWDKALPTGTPVGATLTGTGALAISLDVATAAAPAAVDGVTLPTAANGYLLGLDANGTALWAHAPVQTTKRVQAGRLATGATALVELGVFSGAADFGGGLVMANGDAGATLTTYLLGLVP